MDNMDLFRRTMNYQIERVKKEQSLQFDISVLQDLKRMAELGCFTVYTSSPNDVEVNFYNIKITSYVPRMRWTGEEEICRLKDEVSRLKNEINALSNNLTHTK